MDELNAVLQHRGFDMSAATGHVPSDRKTLPAGDYMFFARRYRPNGEQLEEEQVLNLCIERKTVTDVDRSIKEPSKVHKGLQRMEVQLCKLYYSGMPTKVMLFEEDEDTVRFYVRLNRDTCRRRIKTFRHNLSNGVYYPDIKVVNVLNENETLRYLADQLVKLETEFLHGDRASVTVNHTFGDVCGNVIRAMTGDA